MIRTLEMKTLDVKMKNKEVKSKAQQFADTLNRGNYKEIIAWCKEEVEEYQKLIKILKEKGGEKK